MLYAIAMGQIIIERWLSMCYLFVKWNCVFIFICPIAIAYSMGVVTDYKIGLRLCVSVCVCLSVRQRALSRSHFFIDQIYASERKSG